VNRWAWVACTLAVGAAVAYLLQAAASGSTEYYQTVAEVRSGHAPRGEVRMLGVVGPDIQRSDGGLQVRFTASQDGASIPVVYRGAVPDIFQPGISVVVDGQVGPDGVFVARQLLTKCPSRFQTSAQPRQLR
jgi:cytochrome c-type biogenesis protein CcmE